MKLPSDTILALARSLPVDENDSRQATVSKWWRFLATKVPPVPVADADEAVHVACHLHAKTVGSALLRAVNPALTFDEELSRAVRPGSSGKPGRVSKAGVTGVVVSAPSHFKPGSTADEIAKQAPVSRLYLPKGKRGAMIVWLNESTFIGVTHDDAETTAADVKGTAVAARNVAQSYAAKLGAKAESTQVADDVKAAKKK